MFLLRWCGFYFEDFSVSPLFLLKERHKLKKNSGSVRDRISNTKRNMHDNKYGDTPVYGNMLVPALNKCNDNGNKLHSVWQSGNKIMRSHVCFWEDGLFFANSCMQFFSWNELTVCRCTDYWSVHDSQPAGQENDAWHKAENNQTINYRIYDSKLTTDTKSSSSNIHIGVVRLPILLGHSTSLNCEF